MKHRWQCNQEELTAVLFASYDREKFDSVDRSRDRCLAAHLFCDANIAEPSLLLPSVVVDISSGTIIHDELSEVSVGGMIDWQSAATYCKRLQSNHHFKAAARSQPKSKFKM